MATITIVLSAGLLFPQSQNLTVEEYEHDINTRTSMIGKEVAFMSERLLVRCTMTLVKNGHWEEISKIDRKRKDMLSLELTTI